MATFIKSNCEECTTELLVECNCCGTIQHALGLDDSVTSINFELNPSGTTGVLTSYGYNPCEFTNINYGFPVITVSLINDGTGCFVGVGYTDMTQCDGALKYPAPISLPFTASDIPIYCFGEPDPAFYLTITLS